MTRKKERIEGLGSDVLCGNVVAAPAAGTKTSERREHPDRHWKQRPGRFVIVLSSVDCSSAATPTAAVVNVAVPRNHRRPRTTSTTRDQREEVAVSTSSLVFPVDRSVL